MDPNLENVKKSYAGLYGEAQHFVRAPGRINLIGEHTDYNDGFVLPAAVDQSICFAVGKSEDEGSCQVTALDQNESFQVSLDEIKPMGTWQNYILGVLHEMQEAGRKVKGFNMVFSGNIPQGAGMSSSAALECGACYSLNALWDMEFTRPEMIKMSQMAEHHYAGVKCGIMDQFASMMGRKDQAILLDCRSLEYSYTPVDIGHYSLVLVNSNISHSLASSAYNRRREQCEEGTHELQKLSPEVRSLRDASMELLNRARNSMSSEVYLRCKYVIEENQRVQDFYEALRENNSGLLGDLLRSAHRAMRYEYEITCPEIDFLADLANATPGVLGARMMGGGFGGCTLNIVANDQVESVTSALARQYRDKFGIEATVIPVSIADGVGEIQ